MLSILTTTNYKYFPLAFNLVKSFSEYHSDIPFYVSAINLSEDQKQQLRDSHPNLTLFENVGKFDSEEQERNYCAHDRIWNMPKIMRDYGHDVFWLDSDVYLKGDVSELFDYFYENQIDFMIRQKVSNPFRCNCGMILARKNSYNLSVMDEWFEIANSMGILDYWYADQHSLDRVIQKHFNELGAIKYETFPEKFDGLENNPKTLIVHKKGPKDI